MLALLLCAVLGLVLYGIVRATGEPAAGRVVRLMLAAYATRLVLNLFIRKIPFFSHGVGGDYLGYEAWAITIARIWNHAGISFVTSAELPELGPTTLPQNLFALVIYMNGGPTALGCTTLIALCACLTCFNLYKLAIELGTDLDVAFRGMAVLAFM